MTVGGLIVIDIAIVVGASILIGALAPRVPGVWLATDAGPLTLLPVETPALYRRLGVRALARRLPELGTAFGGSSKSRLPGMTAADLAAYRVELRRAEWVHWLSIAASILAFIVGPWWLAIIVVLVVIGVNLPFILVLRNNRLRIRGILDRNGRRQ